MRAKIDALYVLAPRAAATRANERAVNIRWRGEIMADVMVSKKLK